MTATVAPDACYNGWFKDKSYIVTGASRGLGFEIAKSLLKQDAKVVAHGSNLQTLKDRYASFDQTRISYVAVDFSMTNEGELENEIETRFGPHLETLDGLVNNAGVALCRSIEDTDFKIFTDQMRVNVTAPFLLSKLCAVAWKKAGKPGNIVNLTSTAAFLGHKRHAAYTASKAALDSLTKSFAVEFGRSSLRINSIAPCVMLTEMSIPNWSAPEARDPMMARIPSGRFGEPPEAAQVALFLLSDQATWINGTSISLDGGYLSSGV